MTELSVVGKATPKKDGAEKVTGRTRYLHDLVLPRLAHGKIVRARHPHARIVRIDARRAAALPGVLAVLTAGDVAQERFGFARDQTALKADKVRCVRDEVAAVAAETAAIAEEAAALVEVDYEELPAVFDPRESMRPGAPRVHDERPDNLTDLRYQFSHGDVDRAFAEAAAVVEGVYRLNFVTTCCLETMVAVAEWDAQGGLTMWSTTQVPFLYQRELARALGITGDRVRVMQPPVGGNFGRGLDLYPIDVIAALLARRVGRPVKVEFERLEEFVASPTREPCEIRLRTAADVSGRLLAREAHVTVDNGAYVSWGSTTPYVMLATVAGLYRVPNVRFDTTIAYTNNPYSGSMRGYGNLESTFAVESQMDELADRLGLDRLEIRRRNATKSGDVNPQGCVVTSCAMGECLEAVAEALGPPVPPPAAGWRRGVGYAAMFHVAGGARIYRSDGCGAIVKMDDFGKVALITGATEIGQGSETVLAMIVAETLGVPLDRVEVVNSDTSVKPWDVGAHASRTTFIAGNAARMAAEKLRGDLLAMAAEQLDEPVGAQSSWRPSRSGGCRTSASHAAATTSPAGARWWPRPSTIRRRRCWTRTCTATCRRATPSPPRPSCSTSRRPRARSGCAASSPPTTSAARSTRWPPRGRSTAASTWGSATPWPSVSSSRTGRCSPRRSWTTRSCERTTCPSWWYASSSRTRPRARSVPKASASPA